MPPPVVCAGPTTPATMMLGSAGSNTTSLTSRLPVENPPAVGTVSLSKATLPAAAVAFVERYSPDQATGGMLDDRKVPLMPTKPKAVATKTVPGCVGWTSTFAIARPEKELTPAWPPLAGTGLIG